MKFSGMSANLCGPYHAAMQYREFTNTILNPIFAFEYCDKIYLLLLKKVPSRANDDDDILKFILKKTLRLPIA